MDQPATCDTIARLYARSLDVMESLRSRSLAGRESGRHPPRFPITRTAELVGRTSAAIREAEREGRLPSVERTAAVGELAIRSRRLIRCARYSEPVRGGAGDRVAVIAVQNFKGGVGKSTVSTHLAQYFAIRGYRVCLIDCDSQGSSTALFGYVPDLDIGEDRPSIHSSESPRWQPWYAVRETHWDGLYLVPANLKLYSAEYELAPASRAPSRCCLTAWPKG